MNSSSPELSEIIQIPSNKICIDCNAGIPTHVSLNNSVFVCDKCLEIHKKLPSNISTLKSLSENFLAEEVIILSIGGNARFNAVLAEYQVTSSSSPNKEFKYLLKITEYYRNLLKAELYKGENPQHYEEIVKKKPSPEEGLQLIDAIKTGEFLEQVKEGFKDAFNKVTSIFQAIGSSIKDKMHEKGYDKKIEETSQSIKEKIDKFKADHPEIQQTAQKCAENAKKAQDYIKDKTIQAYNSETCQNLIKKAQDEYNNVKNKAEEIYKEKSKK